MRIPFWRNRRSATLHLFLLLVVFAGLEAVGFTAFALLRLTSRSSLLWAPDVQAFDRGYADYLAKRDTILGWPSPQAFGTSTHDRSGARPLPAFPHPAAACVSLYGESFTYGEDVAHESAWGNLLAQRIGCRVANYAVGGYGTDQALLRFRTMHGDDAGLVVLGIQGDNLKRNVNRFRPLLTGGTRFGFKPRFRLDARDRLELLPLPEIPRARLAEFLEDPANFLEHEHFLPNNGSGPVKPGFSYTLGMVRLFRHADVLSVLFGRTTWERFYEPAHASGALAVTIGIATGFVREAEDRGKRAVVIMFPTGRAAARAQATGRWPYQTLIDSLVQRGIRTYDLGPDMLASLADRPFCDLVGGPETCAAHYNEEGNRLVADLVYQHVVRERVAARTAGMNP